MKFPKTIYVKPESDGSTEYMVPHEHAVDAAEMGKTIKVGVYKLVELQTVKGVAVTNTVKR